VDPHPEFQVPAPPSKSLWLPLQPSKIASALTPQTCGVLGSLARVAGQFIVRLKLFSKWELSIGLDFKSNVLYKSIASKKIQSDINYVLKNTSVHMAAQALMDEPE